MNDMDGVCLCYRLTSLQHEVDCSREREALFAYKDVREILAAEVLHDDVVATSKGSDINDSRDMLASNLDGCTTFAEKPCHGVRVGRQARQEHLYSDLLIEMDMRRRENEPHPTSTKHTINPILLGE